MKIKLKRFIAFYIDGIIACIPTVAVTLILSLFAGNEFMKIFISYICPLLWSLTFIFKDSFGGRSIGKMIMHLRITYSTKDKKSILFYAVRNLISFIPIAPIYSLIAPKSLGDVIMKTTVEEVK